MDEKTYGRFTKAISQYNSSGFLSSTLLQLSTGSDHSQSIVNTQQQMGVTALIFIDCKIKIR